MIIDIEKRKRLSYGSAQKVLCRCDECGAEKMVTNQSIPAGCDYTLCARCSASKSGKANAGRIRSAEHRRKTGEASRARNAGAILVAYTMANPRIGSANNRWIADRDHVARAELARREAYSLLNNTLKRIGVEKATRTEEMLGYTKPELVEHIERQFLDGMSWDNRKEWHIDHIKTVAEFVREGVTDLRIINALTNLRPLWATDNLARRFNSAL